MQRSPFLLIATLTFSVSVTTTARAQSEAAAIFTKKCSSCHTFGKGDLIGPDLKGVTSRRARPWLIDWIRSSDEVIRRGDPTAVTLFSKYKQQRMPDHDLSVAQVEGLLDYLAKDGPQADAGARARHANTATSQEIQLGRDIFYGKVALSNGGASCSACHGVSMQRGVGSLGPDLTNAYVKYQDKGLASLIRRACLRRVPSADGKPIKAEECFAIKAFLYDTAIKYDTDTRTKDR